MITSVAAACRCANADFGMCAHAEREQAQHSEFDKRTPPDHVIFLARSRRTGRCSLGGTQYGVYPYGVHLQV